VGLLSALDPASPKLAELSARFSAPALHSGFSASTAFASEPPSEVGEASMVRISSTSLAVSVLKWFGPSLLMAVKMAFKLFRGSTPREGCLIAELATKIRIAARLIWPLILLMAWSPSSINGSFVSPKVAQAASKLDLLFLNDFRHL